MSLFHALLIASTLLRPARVFDGTTMHDGWVVLVRGDRIAAVGPASQVGTPSDATVIDLPGMTLLPGLIEGHSHLFLHAYDETPWDVQVLKEPLALRTARAWFTARATLMAGFTTERDLGTEGAGFSDVGLKQAIDEGIVPGPRLIVVTRAIVATGSYGPKGFDPRWDVPQGAQEADGVEGVTHAVREQIGKGADWIKVYADYRWGPNGAARPTFTLEELKTIVEVAKSSGRPVAAHAATDEGVRRATLAGVETVEHADAATPETFALMAKQGVALCPTLAADDAIARYRGWKPGVDSEPAFLAAKRASFKAALAAHAHRHAGGDVGVYPHGDNAREMELMAAWGMSPIAVLRAATSVNARIFHVDDRVGALKPGLLADVIAVEGDPAANINAIRKVRLVMKGGAIVRKD